MQHVIEADDLVITWSPGQNSIHDTAEIWNPATGLFTLSDDPNPAVIDVSSHHQDLAWDAVSNLLSLTDDPAPATIDLSKYEQDLAWDAGTNVLSLTDDPAPATIDQSVPSKTSPE